jgi:5-methylcytosine-specific restriction endonuclease McrA
MRKLAIPTIDEPKSHKEILKKRHASKDVTEAVLKRLEDYDAACPDLRKLPDAPAILAGVKDNMKGMYRSTTEEAVAIRRAIRKSAPERCPYCGRPTKPNTIDHFLPQDSHPEYSIYFKNLIPCCRDCNYLKLAKTWNDNGIRYFLNPYYDPFILDKEIVTVDIYPDFNTPLFAFTHDWSGANSDSRTICESHFKELDVTGLLKQFCAQRLRTIRRKYVSDIRAGTMSVDYITRDLTNEAEAYIIDFGLNCWEAVLYRAILKNDALMQFIKTVPLLAPPALV